MVYFSIKNATIICDIIAITAMIIAAYEIRKALREIDKLSDSLASRKAASLAASSDKA